MSSTCNLCGVDAGGRRACDDCCRRVGALILESDPEDLTALWPCAAKLDPVTQACARLQSPAGQYQSPEYPKIECWLLAHLAVDLLRVRENPSSPHGVYVSRGLANALGSTARTRFDGGADMLPDALLVAARALIVKGNAKEKELALDVLLAPPLAIDGIIDPLRARLRS